MDSLRKSRVIWEGDEYLVDFDAKPGSRVLVKEHGKFVSKPGIGILGATLMYEGISLDDNEDQ
jgi:hypothetical protein